MSSTPSTTSLCATPPAALGWSPCSARWVCCPLPPAPFGGRGAGLGVLGRGGSPPLWKNPCIKTEGDTLQGTPCHAGYDGSVIHPMVCRGLFRGSSLTLIGSSICDNTSLKRENLHMFDICATTSVQIYMGLSKYEKHSFSNSSTFS